MFTATFNTVVYQPLYNGLIFLMSVVPWADAGVSVILFTVLVKLLLYPLSEKAIQTQVQMKAAEGELALIKERHKDDREGLARATMAFYKEKGIRPFSSLLVALIQIPIIFALYFIFYSGGLPEVNTKLLYPFVSAPVVDMHFLGLVDITKGSLVLALLVGVSQYFQTHFAMPPAPPKPTGTGTGFKDDFARTLQFQMRYFLPALVAVIAYSIAGAVSLYWITSNVFAIGQELYVRRVFKRAK